MSTFCRTTIRTFLETQSATPPSSHRGWYRWNIENCVNIFLRRFRWLSLGVYRSKEWGDWSTIYVCIDHSWRIKWLFAFGFGFRWLGDIWSSFNERHQSMKKADCNHYAENGICGRSNMRILWKWRYLIENQHPRNLHERNLQTYRTPRSLLPTS